MSLSLDGYRGALVVIAKCDRQSLGRAIDAYLFEHPDDELHIARLVEDGLKGQWTHLATEGETP